MCTDFPPPKRIYYENLLSSWYGSSWHCSKVRNGPRPNAMWHFRSGSFILKFLKRVPYLLKYDTYLSDSNFVILPFTAAYEMNLRVFVFFTFSFFHIFFFFTLSNISLFHLFQNLFPTIRFCIYFRIFHYFPFIPFSNVSSFSSQLFRILMNFRF